MHVYNLALSGLVASAAISLADASDVSVDDFDGIDMHSDVPVLDLLRANVDIRDIDEDLAGRKLGKSSKSSKNGKSGKKSKASKMSKGGAGNNRAGDSDSSSKSSSSSSAGGKKKKKKKKNNRTTNNGGKTTQTKPKPIIVNKADNSVAEEGSIINKAGGEPIVTLTPAPSNTPTLSPSKTPTVPPSASPTADPTSSPTADPTSSPTAGPTSSPTDAVVVEDVGNRPFEQAGSDWDLVDPDIYDASGKSQPLTTDSYTFVPATDPELVAVDATTFLPDVTSSPTVAPTMVPSKTPTVPPTVSPSKAPTTADPTASPSKIPTVPEPAPTASAMGASPKADLTASHGDDWNRKYQCFYEQGIKICFSYHDDQKCEMSIDNRDCSCCVFTDMDHPVISSFDCTNLGSEWGGMGICMAPDSRGADLEFSSQDGV